MLNLRQNPEPEEEPLVGPTRRRRTGLDELEEWFGKARKFVWDEKRGLFLGRNESSWAKLIFFYFVFYTCLFGFLVALMMLISYPVIDDNVPLLGQGPTAEKNCPFLGLDKCQNAITVNPGMGFRPMPDYRTTLVRFEQGKPSSYKPFTDHLQSFMLQYENEQQESENFIDCSNLRPEDRDINKICRFNIEDLGAECTWQKDYGYDEGKPCVLLKLNRIFGWEPDMFHDASEFPDDMPEEARSRWTPDSIVVSCEGENPLDKENIGPISYWPSAGYSALAYPFINQEGYRQPLVFIRFDRPENGVVINVWCKAWAKNIQHHRFDRAGSVHFEMLVD